MKLRAASIAEYSALPVLATTVIALVHSGWMPKGLDRFVYLPILV